MWLHHLRNISPKVKNGNQVSEILTIPFNMLLQIRRKSIRLAGIHGLVRKSDRNNYTGIVQNVDERTITYVVVLIWNNSSMRRDRTNESIHGSTSTCQLRSTIPVFHILLLILALGDIDLSDGRCRQISAVFVNDDLWCLLFAGKSKMVS